VDCPPSSWSISERAQSAPSAPPSMETGLGAAFERIYQEWFPHVSRWVLTLGARRADHEDVVQDVFTVAYRRLGDFDGSNVAGWLYQIARRKVRDYRRLFWVQHVASDGPALFDCPGEERPGPLDDLETKERSQALGRRLARLPCEQRAVFTLFELEGFSGHEIAQQQDVSVNTVWMRLYNARRKLKTHPAPSQPKRRASTA
jgi:RNA polymerase sigma-70 factor, ECF subfamily